MLNKIIVSYGLPKTGTSFLGGILSQSNEVSVSAIKEPTFSQYDFRFSESKVLDRIIVDGNSSLGWEWYSSLFQNSNYQIDLSTQYWITPPKFEKNINIKRFIIRRDPFDQLLSYVTHLRRGYIPNTPLEFLLNDDVGFSNYLRAMYQYGVETYSNNFDADNNIHKFEFNDLINNTENFMEDFLYCFGITPFNFGMSSVRKNSAAYPKIVGLNSFLMNSNINSKIKRIAPLALFRHLINFRKKIINLNLDAGVDKLNLKIKDKIFLDKWV